MKRNCKSICHALIAFSLVLMPSTMRAQENGQLSSSERQQVIDNIINSMVKVDGGTLTSSSTIGKTSVKSFNICNHEVTQREWKAVMGTNPSKYKGDDKPVEQVSWNDCQAFIRKLNTISGRKFRLPSEAEWEFAARGGNKSRGYKYSGSDTASVVSWFFVYNGERSVERKKANELGLYDMSGNVWEWCQDKFKGTDDPSFGTTKEVHSANDRVCRGGSWNDVIQYSEVSSRRGFAPSLRYCLIGFRLAM